MWVLLSLSLSCAGVALVVAGISLAVVDSDLPWRCGGALYVAGTIAWVPFFVRRSRGLEAHRSIVLRPIFMVVASVPSTIALLSQLSNAVGWPYRPNSAVFFLALLVPIGVSASTFADLLLVRPEAESTDA